MHGYVLDLNEFAPRPEPLRRKYSKYKYFSATDDSGTRFVFENIKEIIKYLGVTRCAVYNAINRKNRTCQGYHIEAIS